jgi:hypothetical protein
MPFLEREGPAGGVALETPGDGLADERTHPPGQADRPIVAADCRLKSAPSLETSSQRRGLDTLDGLHGSGFGWYLLWGGAPTWELGDIAAELVRRCQANRRREL